MTFGRLAVFLLMALTMVVFILIAMVGMGWLRRAFRSTATYDPPAAAEDDEV